MTLDYSTNYGSKEELRARAKHYLKLVRNVLEEPHHWIKGEYTDGQGAFCLQGAGMHVAKQYNIIAPHIVSTALRQALPEDASRNFVDFNDNPTTTHQDILDLLDRAIDIIERDNNMV